MSNTGLNSLNTNDKFSGDVKIIKKAIPGPVVFMLTNGVGAVEAGMKENDLNVEKVI